MFNLYIINLFTAVLKIFIYNKSAFDLLYFHTILRYIKVY